MEPLTASVTPATGSAAAAPRSSAVPVTPSVAWLAASVAWEAASVADPVTSSIWSVAPDRNSVAFSRMESNRLMLAKPLVDGTNRSRQ
jgi:hypothetical protein